MESRDTHDRWMGLIAWTKDLLEREHALAANEDVQKNEAACSEPSQEKST